MGSAGGGDDDSLTIVLVITGNSFRAHQPSNAEREVHNDPSH